MPDDRQPAAPPARQGFGLALTILTTALFACITTCSRFAYNAGSNPETLLLIRFSCFVLGVGLAHRLSGRAIRPDRSMIAPAVGIAAFILLLSAGYLTAAALLPIGLAVLLLYTAPFFVALLSVAMNRDKMTPAKGATMVLAFVGVALAVGPDFSHLDPGGIIAGFCAALGLVLMIAVGGRWMQRHDPVSLNVSACLLLILPMAGYLALTGRLALPVGASGWLGLAGATFCFVAGNLSWGFAMRFTPPIRMAVVMNLEIPLSIVFGALFLGERLGPVQLLGAALILSAVTGLTLAGRAKNEAAVNI